MHFSTLSRGAACRRSCCGVERIYNLAEQLQTEIVRVDARFSIAGSVHIFHLHFQLNRVALSVGELTLWCGAHRRCVSRVLEEFLVSSMNSLGDRAGRNTGPGLRRL